MKKKMILFPILAIGGYLMLTSYASGPAANNAGNHTGSFGPTTANCSGGGCHNANSTTTSAAIALLDANNQPVTSYTPGNTYTVKITGSNTNTAITHFGFQATAVLSDKKQAGNFTIPSGVSSQIHTSAGINPGPVQIVEHSAPISSSNNNYSIAFDWTAPASGSGTVTFYSMLNAVNVDNNPLTDFPNSATPLAISEGTTGINSVTTATMNITAYPNPLMDAMHLNIDKVQAGAYTLNVYDVTGKKVYSNNLNIGSSNYSTTVNTHDWKSGMYNVQLSGTDGAQRTLSVVKF